MGRQKLSKAETDRVGSIIWNFFEKQRRFKEVQAKFNAIKDDFESEMEGLFHGFEHNTISITNHNLAAGTPNTLKVTKVEKTLIHWDIDKLRKRLPKNIFKQVVRKEYKVVGMDQLVKYLKSCGVDPAVFKQYIIVEESVDQDKVDEAGELGFITAQQISGCYTVECQKPYFRVSLVKGKSDGGTA